MRWNEFVKKLTEDAHNNHSRAIVQINPSLVKLPLPIQRFDDPFLPFSKATIDVTRDICCAYWLDMASFLTLGAAGARALERTIGYIGKDTLKILHGPFVGHAYSTVVDDIAFAADALTLIRSQDVDYYLNHSPFSAFLEQLEDTELPKTGGIYMPTSQELACLDATGQPQRFYLTQDDVLFAGKFDDFASEIRKALLGKNYIYD